MISNNESNGNGKSTDQIIKTIDNQQWREQRWWRKHWSNNQNHRRSTMVRAATARVAASVKALIKWMKRAWGGVYGECEVRVKPKRKRESEVERGKNNKILNGRAIATVHICTIIVVFVRKYTILHPLIWVFFFFFIKMCKMSYFFYFERLWNHWCSCS